MSSLSFHVFMDNPHTHTFTIKMHIPAMGKDVLSLALPVWTPGSYLVREYSKNINRLYCEDKNVGINKTAKNTWEITTNNQAIDIIYELYAFEESVRTCWLDSERASIIPAGMFLFIEDTPLPVNISFHPHHAFKDIATSLPMVNNDPWVRFAADADTLYDSPIEIGNHITQHFNAAGVEHTLVISGTGNYHIPSMITDMQAVIETEVNIFKHHPCKSYLIILNTSNTLRGGLEHLHSTSLIFKRLMFADRSNYQEFISLFAHEYFHLWNVKRLRPKALGPFNYITENYTTSLWIAEGFTSYYDDLIVYRTGLYAEEEYLTIVEKNINLAENAPGKKIMSVAEASFDAWIKYYRQNENSENSQVNYYVRGGVLATLLDILIIHHSDGKHNLDNVMRTAYERFYVNRDSGYTEDEFKAVIEEFAGISMNDFYRQHVFGTSQIAFNDILCHVGLQLENTLENTIESDLGITINNNNIITAVRRNSAGEQAGIYVTDEIIAINGYRYSNGLLASLTADAKTGDKLEIILSKSGRMHTVSATIQITDKVNYRLKAMDDANDSQRAHYAKWLLKNK